jgi:hypothetical protein
MTERGGTDQVGERRRERRDWRDTLRDASDLALLGIVLTIAAVPVVTLGAVIAAGSAAVHDWVHWRQWPPVRQTLRRFARALLPGLGVLFVAVFLAWLIGVDVAAVQGGRVPGGRWLLGGTLVVVLFLVGYAGLTVVEVGRQEASRWLTAVGSAFRVGLARPQVPLALGGVVALATLLSVFIPVVAPILVGYVLFALHVVAARLAPPAGDDVA